MLSENDLETYERVISGREYDGTYIKRIVTKLIKDIRKLEKEADYLAGCIEWCPDDVPMGACYDICSDGDEFVPKEKCVQCWRERARKEGSNASS